MISSLRVSCRLASKVETCAWNSCLIKHDVCKFGGHLPSHPSCFCKTVRYFEVVHESLSRTFLQLGMPVGTIKACVLIENVLAAFEMEEILYELRQHSLGLNCGIWGLLRILHQQVLVGSKSCIERPIKHPELYRMCRVNTSKDNSSFLFVLANLFCFEV